MQGWTSFCERRCRCRRLVGKCLHEYEWGGVRSSWQTWVAHVNVMKQEEATKGERERMTRKAMLKMRSVFISQALNAWIEFVATKKRRRHCVQQVAARWRSGALVRSMDAWCDMTVVRKHCRKVINKTVRRLRHKDMTRAMKQWSFAVQEQASVATMQQMTVRRVVGRFRLRLVASAWSRWVSVVTDLGEISRGARVVARFVQSMAHRQLAVGYHTWKSWALRRGFEQTHQLTAETHQRRVLERVLRRLQLRSQSRALETWASGTRGHANRTASAKRLMRMVRRWHEKLLWAGWHRWADATVNARDMETNQATAVGRLHRTVDRMRRVVMWRAWNAWTTRVQEVVARGRSADQTVRWLLVAWKRVEFRLLSEAVRKWKLMVFAAEQHLSASIAMMNTSARKIQARAMGRAFTQWRDVAVNVALQDQLENLVLVRDALLRWRHWNHMAGLAEKDVGVGGGETMTSTPRTLRRLPMAVAPVSFVMMCFFYMFQMRMRVTDFRAS